MGQFFEDEILAEEEPSSVFQPVSYVLQFVASYGWYMVMAVAAGLYAVHKLRPVYRRWQEAREDAEFHKDPDKALARMEAIQRAREQQQQLLKEASVRALEQEKEREEKKHQEKLQLLNKYGGERKLGTSDGDGYLPLSGGGHSSSYRPTRRSACGGGGCGR